jgi:hypothetical protein
MTGDALLSGFKPRGPKPPREGERLWMLTKDGVTVTADLLDQGEAGVELRMFRNGEGQSGRRFLERDRAIAHAGSLRQQLLTKAGWLSRTRNSEGTMQSSTCVFLALLIAGSFADKQSAPTGAFACDVTVPNGIVAGSDKTVEGSYGNAQLSVGPFGLWPNGTVVFKRPGPGFFLADGSLSMKFGWTRGVQGRLTVDGRRLDATAPALRADVPDDNGDTGFQPSALIFPTPGCWEVSGHVADARLTFVTRVVKIEEP